MADDDIEQTLHIARSISVYRIPPRPGANGWRSGEWLVSDKLFSGRMRIVAKGELCQIRLEDTSSGELFAMCPVTFGQRNVCVEPVTDSSRYYVLRVEDPTTHRHAFLGMGFNNRSDAFDFNEALVRHEQHVARERAATARASDVDAAASLAASGSGLAGGSSPQQYKLGPAPGTSSANAANSTAAAEVDLLYRQAGALRLQEGQTIRVNVSGLKRPGSATPDGGGFLSNTTSAGLLRAGGPAPLLPPPAVASTGPQVLLATLNFHQEIGCSQPLSQPSVVTSGVGKPSLLDDDGPSTHQTGTGLLHEEASSDATSGLDNWARFD